MNVNGLNNNLIDTASVNQVTANLFNALQKKSVDYSKVNLSKFNRASLGVDFYNSKTDINLQREASLANSSAFQQLNLASVRALNAYAAQSAYADIQERLGGKLTINTPEQFDFISEVDDIENTINVFETNKDKKDIFNPFSFGDNGAKKEEA